MIVTTIGVLHTVRRSESHLVLIEKLYYVNVSVSEALKHRGLHSVAPPNSDRETVAVPFLIATCSHFRDWRLALYNSVRLIIRQHIDKL